MKSSDPITIKSCYSHIGGKFGNLLTQRLIELGWIAKVKDVRDFKITKKGEQEFTKLGIDFSELQKQ